MNASRIRNLLLSVLLLGAPAPAFAFPELVRYGYANCVTCHINPGGSGVLNEYGREISREVLSTWGTETESAFAWGAVKTPEWLSATVLARSLSFIRDTETTIDGRTVLMQLDAEAAVTLGDWTADIAVGAAPRYAESPVNIRRAYALKRWGENFSLRAGKFMQVYGLMPADHRIPIRSGLGWDQGTESLNVEAAWIGENFSLFGTANLGELGGFFVQGEEDEEEGGSSSDPEHGGTISGSVFFSDRFKVGVSAFAGVRSQSGKSRVVFGPNAALGFTPHLFWLGEVDIQSDGAPPGIFQYQKLSYEIIQGLHLYIAQDLSQLSLSNVLTRTWSYSPGIQFFPRPHFEAQFYVRNQEYMGRLHNLNTTTWTAMLNFYL